MKQDSEEFEDKSSNGDSASSKSAADENESQDFLETDGDFLDYGMDSHNHHDALRLSLPDDLPDSGFGELAIDVFDPDEMPSQSLNRNDRFQPLEESVSDKSWRDIYFSETDEEFEEFFEPSQSESQPQHGLSVNMDQLLTVDSNDSSSNKGKIIAKPPGVKQGKSHDKKKRKTKQSRDSTNKAIDANRSAPLALEPLGSHMGPSTLQDRKNAASSKPKTGSKSSDRASLSSKRAQTTGVRNKTKEANRSKSASNVTHRDRDDRPFTKEVRSNSSAKHESATARGSNRKKSRKQDNQAITNKIIRNRFELKRKVGAGGMGTIYKAIDQIMVEANDRNPYVAVKILRDELKRNPEAFKALQREYRKALRLAHPNIVQVYDFDRDGDLIYMTMEFLQGKDLEKVLRKYKKRGLPLGNAMPIINGICDALIHAHKKNLIHYDFKPSNIFITNSGEPKVFDFGISRAVKAKLDAGGDSLFFEPKSFTALTPTYASPEMIRGEVPDVRDDVYALAVVTYEIICGLHPFNRWPANEAQAQGLTPPKLTCLTRRQWLTLKKALHFERSKRLENVQMFRDGMLENANSRRILRRTVIGSMLLMVAIFQSVAIAIAPNSDGAYSRKYHNSIQTSHPPAEINVLPRPN